MVIIAIAIPAVILIQSNSQNDLVGDEQQEISEKDTPIAQPDKPQKPPEKIETKTAQNLKVSTSLYEKKFNIFIFSPQKINGYE